MQKHIICLFLVGLFASPAFAVNVPEWDINAACKEKPSFADGSDQIELHCRKSEAASKERIAQMDASERAVKTCIEVGESSVPSYQIMEQCLKGEMEAEKELGN